MAQPPNTVYDPDSDEKPVQSGVPSIDKPGGLFNPHGDKNNARENDTTKDELRDKESGNLFNPAGDSTESPSSSPDKKTGREEGGGWFTPDSDNKQKTKRKFWTKKKAAAGGGIIGGSMFVAVMFSGVSQGPLQFVHMSQLFQQFHLSSNEDFGDDRTAKYLYYALAGSAENGRLGVGGNFVANKYEANLRKQGIKPVYDKSTGRLIGFATSDKNIADSMRAGSEDKTNLKKVSEERDIKGSKKYPDLDGDDYFVSMRGEQCSFKCRRAVLKNVLRTTHVSKIVSSVGYRLLIKRGGIGMHPLNKVKQKAEESDNKYIKGVLGRDAEEMSKGSLESHVKNRTYDENGQPVDTENTEVDAAAEDGKAESRDQGGVGESNLDIYKKAIVRAGGGAALTVGILCAAQDYGDSVADYKFTNIALPVMRMGSKAVSIGDQVKSSDDLSTDALKPYAYRLHDKNAPRGEQSWVDAKSIQAELGQPQTGPDVPEEARLGNVNDKPAFFDLVNKIPGLSEACEVQDFFQGLPVIKETSEVISNVTGTVANAALEPFGTSTEELAARALAMVAGDTINPFAKGAEYGNLANVGAFMAGNDNARTMGGVPLSNEDVALLKNEASEDVRMENSRKSIAQRYFDVYDATSLVGSAIDTMPSTVSSVASLMTNIGSIFGDGVAKTFALLSPKAKAATSGFNYGVPKYGFSPSDRDDPRFEDPYENARIVEESGMLDELNEKYGKNCFGMSVTTDATVESNDQGGEGVNLFKVMDEHPECDPKNNSDEWFLRYRFYLADASVNTAMTCFFGNEDSCAALGFAATSESPEDSNSTNITGDAKDLAQQILNAGNLTDQDGRYMAQIKAIAEGDFSCNVNPTILKMLVGVTVKDGHKVTMSSLNRKCTGVITASGEGSYHYRDGGGHAIDVVGFDGDTTTGGSGDATLKYLNVASKYLPEKTGYGQVNSCGSGFQIPSGSYDVPDSCNHQHIQVPERQAE